jgi:hypothetical protein
MAIYLGHVEPILTLYVCMHHVRNYSVYMLLQEQKSVTCMRSLYMYAVKPFRASRPWEGVRPMQHAPL